MNFPRCVPTQRTQNKLCSIKELKAARMAKPDQNAGVVNAELRRVYLNTPRPHDYFLLKSWRSVDNRKTTYLLLSNIKVTCRGGIVSCITYRAIRRSVGRLLWSPPHPNTERNGGDTDPLPYPPPFLGVMPGQEERAAAFKAMFLFPFPTTVGRRMMRSRARAQLLS